MRSDEIRKEALSLYSHANVRDRYDADLMMAGFTDGAEWADAHPEPQGEPTDAQVMAASLALDGQIAFELVRAALRAAYETKGEGQ